MNDQQEVRVARNEVSYRTINDQQAGASRDFHGEAPSQRLAVLCECADPSCQETLELAASEYQHVRSDARWFVVRSGHVVPDVEVPVEQHDGWWIVEKTMPIGRMIAEETA